jgi:Na+-translocating ferredoxin:NAD+ oxidoreductase RnfD subunit
MGRVFVFKAFEGSKCMKRFELFFLSFLQEPLWFKLLVSTTFFASVIFSSTFFSYNAYYDSGSKVAVAIFLGAYGFKLRRTRKYSIPLFFLSGISLYLAWYYASNA